MKASDMQRGMLYRLKDGKVVTCYGFSHSSKFVIVHYPDEPDMQSSFGIPLDEEVEELPQGDKT